MIFILGALALLFAAYEVYVNVSGTLQGQGTNFQSPVAIYRYATAAGFSGTDAVTATAIALAESSGDANAYNPELLAGTATGQGSVGLWQIYQAAHPEFAGQDLTDPQTNANAAYSVYSAAGNSFSPWTTFKALSAENLSTAQSAADDSADDSEDDSGDEDNGGD